jgi:hypothetical protein
MSSQRVGRSPALWLWTRRAPAYSADGGGQKLDDRPQNFPLRVCFGVQEQPLSSYPGVVSMEETECLLQAGDLNGHRHRKELLQANAPSRVTQPMPFPLLPPGLACPERLLGSNEPVHHGIWSGRGSQLQMVLDPTPENGGRHRLEHVAAGAELH